MSLSVTQNPSQLSDRKKFTFMEFFAGGGMARAGLGFRWKCLFANDFDAKKSKTYRKNWGDEDFYFGDVNSVDAHTLPSDSDLAWASFPCQDLSLAGAQAGLEGNRSGAFWGFWKLMRHLQERNSHPKTIVLENVYGAVTSNGGRDFATLLNALNIGGYRVGALVIDAVHFVPQSRPRLFIIAARNDLRIPSKLHLKEPLPLWTPLGLSSALRDGELGARAGWISWRLPLPSYRRPSLADLIDDVPDDVHWHSARETERLLDMMSCVNRQKVRQAQLAGRKVVGTLYKRTRAGSDGVRRQCAEVRFDDVAGCLRTPGGGSSRQTIVVVDGKKIRSRLITGRETARLMGLSEAYILPSNPNDAYHLTGDGVAVPVVRHLSEYILEPLLRAQAVERLHVA